VPDEHLHQLATNLAAELTQLIHRTVGPSCAPFMAVPVSGTRDARIREEAAEGRVSVLFSLGVVVIVAMRTTPATAAAGQ